MFTGFDEDGDALYDTKEAAIERAKQMRQWDCPGLKIMVHRKYVPLWFAHLVREGPLEFLGYSILDT